MAHTLAYAASYVKALDKSFKKASVTTNLDAKPGSFKESDVDAATIYISTLALQGLATYSRETGYVAGNATVAWNAHTFSQERGRKFTLDTQDLRETYLQAAQIGMEFTRVHVAPEVDAYRFEALVSACGIDVNADLDYDNTLEAIDEGIKTLDDAEVPEEGRVLYVSNSVYKNMKESGEFTYVRYTDTVNGANVSREIATYENMRIIKVPAARFYSDFDFSASGAGGFSAASGGYAINFIIVYEPIALGIIKHVKPKLVDPAVNTDGDFYVYGYRIYHDLFVTTNKVSGAYIHCVATAET